MGDPKHDADPVVETIETPAGTTIEETPVQPEPVETAPVETESVPE